MKLPEISFALPSLNLRPFRRKSRFLLLAALIHYLAGCASEPSENEAKQDFFANAPEDGSIARFKKKYKEDRYKEYYLPYPNRVALADQFHDFRTPISKTEVTMIEHGLIDIQQLDPTIAVDLKYASTDNFLGMDVYEGMQRAYLQPDVAMMLVRAQKYLRSIQPDYSLIVFDAARPLRIQQKLWDAIDAPFQEKIRFLSNPANGSIHNFGAAADVSIIDQKGELLDMGTPFDYMGELAYPSLEQEMLEEGRLQPYQIANRRLLRQVMRHGGFWGIQTEWWHFNACTRAEARERYTIIE